MSPRLRHKTVRLDFPEGSDEVRLAVLGDTHSRPHSATTDLIAEMQPDLILHSGDVGDLSFLDKLELIAPTVAVRGNVDSRGSGLPDLLTLEVYNIENTRFILFMAHVGLNGIRLRSPIRELARDRGAGLVICGHSHIPFLGVDRDLSVFNPGSAGPKRFNLPVTLGRVILGDQKTSMIHIDCTTGRQWLPDYSI